MFLQTRTFPQPKIQCSYIRVLLYVEIMLLQVNFWQKELYQNMYFVYDVHVTKVLIMIRELLIISYWPYKRFYSSVLLYEDENNFVSTDGWTNFITKLYEIVQRTIWSNFMRYHKKGSIIFINKSIEAVSNKNMYEVGDSFSVVKKNLFS